MVADGMGAHAAGELASKMACESVPPHLSQAARSPARRRAAPGRASPPTRPFTTAARPTPSFRAWARPAARWCCCRSAAIVAHVGDSRVYRLRSATARPVDVRPQPGLGNDGRRPDAARRGRQLHSQEHHHPLARPACRGAGRSGRAVSARAWRHVSVVQRRPERTGERRGDRRRCLSALSPQEAVRVLVDMANLRGGPDNITAIAARVSALPTDGDRRSRAAAADPSDRVVDASGVVDRDGRLPAGGLGTGCWRAIMSRPLSACCWPRRPPSWRCCQALRRSRAGDRTDATAAVRRSGPTPRSIARPTPQPWPCFARWPSNCARPPRTSIGRSIGRRFNAYGEQAQAALAARDFTEARCASTPWRSAS